MAFGVAMPRSSHDGRHALWQCVILPRHSSHLCISAISTVSI